MSELFPLIRPALEWTLKTHRRDGFCIYVYVVKRVFVRHLRHCPCCGSSTCRSSTDGHPAVGRHVEQNHYDWIDNENVKAKEQTLE